MAEVKTPQEKTDNKSDNTHKNKLKSVNPTFNTFDIFCVLFSLGTFVADLSTDLILVVEYSRCGHIGWAVSTLLLMLLPASVVQLFSLRWHKLDEQISTSNYVFHACLLGIVQRYYYVLRTGLEARSSDDFADFQKLYQQQSDLCMLHLFESFMESAPQLILQLFVMLNVGEWHSWTGLSASASLCSLAWAIAAYTRAMRRVRLDKNRVEWPGLVLQATWRGGMLAARISALLLFALAFNYWILAVMGIHWLAMTIWVIKQNTDFCPTPWEEKIYNGIVGVIYCFSFFNISEGRSRKRVLAFYTIIITQNIACLIIVVSLDLIASLDVLIVCSVLIIGGTVIGLSSMTLYYIKFHPAGPIPCCSIFSDIENASTPSTPPKDSPTIDPESKTNTLRSLKHMWTLERGCNLNHTEGSSIKSSPHSDDGVCTDKKLLLENWIARSGSPMFISAPISQDPNNTLLHNLELEDMEFHTVVNSADVSYDKGVVNEGFSEKNFSLENNEKLKRRGICSPKELGLKLSQLDDSKAALVSQKRRGICSSDQLILDDLNDVNLDDEVKLKRRPIYSLHNNYTSELISLKSLYSSSKIMKLCSDDKSVCSSGTLKPEEYMEMSSEVLSAHDYENICAVNIARERWGLRSWEGYTDIETYLHDDSTVRDRRRDTLASTMTGGSSEISSSDTAASPPPLLPNRKPRPLRSRQDDYLDTLIYDLVDCDNKRVHILDCTTSIDDQLDSTESNNLFTAKPFIIDQHGAFFPLGSTLEPILELEEPCLTPDKGEIFLRKPRSALVATIDEIRRGTDTDSPRNVYHRTEHVWDDEEIVKKSVVSSVVRTNVVKALWSELPAKISSPTMIANIDTSKKMDRDEKLNIIKSSLPKPKAQIPVIKTLDTDLPDRYPEDNPKKRGNKPRRKFSLLREKFEPKVKQSDLSSPEMGSTLNLIDDAKSAKFTPPVITKVIQWNNIIRNQNKNSPTVSNNDVLNQENNTNINNEVAIADDRSSFTTFRDKRNVFLKQVLSPPKFNSRSKRTSSSIITSK